MDWKLMGSLLPPANDVADFIEDLEALPIKVDPDSERHVFSAVHDVAIKYRLTTYDAAYLELAQRRNLPLATFDSELAAACRRAGLPLFGSQD